jgi:hypothetical protein
MYFEREAAGSVALAANPLDLIEEPTQLNRSNSLLRAPGSIVTHQGLHLDPAAVGGE